MIGDPRWNKLGNKKNELENKSAKEEKRREL
jgi:hypothetical protein